MHSKAFWAENSNFEFSWQIQLQSWLHGVLSDSGGGGRDSGCKPRAGKGQATEEVRQSENRSSSTRPQFQSVSDSEFIFFLLTNKQKAGPGKGPRSAQALLHTAGPSKGQGDNSGV